MNEKEKEKDVILDEENEAGSISPTDSQSSSKASFTNIDSKEVEINKDNETLKKVDESSIEVIEMNGGPKKDIETGDEIKEKEVETETILIPADRKEEETVNTTTVETNKENETDEGNFVSDNLPLISVGVIAVALIVAFVVSKIKSSKKNKEN